MIWLKKTTQQEASNTLQWMTQVQCPMCHADYLLIVVLDFIISFLEKAITCVYNPMMIGHFDRFCQDSYLVIEFYGREVFT